MRIELAVQDALLAGLIRRYDPFQDEPCSECGNTTDDALGNVCQTCRDWFVEGKDTPMLLRLLMMQDSPKEQAWIKAGNRPRVGPYGEPLPPTPTS
jgi:hypothetical protein